MLGACSTEHYMALQLLCHCLTSLTGLSLCIIKPGASWCASQSLGLPAVMLCQADDTVDSVIVLPCLREPPVYTHNCVPPVGPDSEKVFTLEPGDNSAFK